MSAMGMVMVSVRFREASQSRQSWFYYRRLSGEPCGAEIMVLAIEGHDDRSREAINAQSLYG